MLALLRRYFTGEPDTGTTRPSGSEGAGRKRTPVMVQRAALPPYLRGFERALVAVSKRYRIAVIRYADDVVILCEDLETLMAAKRRAETWLAEVGLRLKESKSRVTHTLDAHEGNLGFDFLGFNIRQYRVGKHRTRTYRGKAGFKTLIKPSRKAIERHLDKIRDIIRRHRGAPQAALIAALNPVIQGWAMNYRTCVAKRVFIKVNTQVYEKLTRWARFRHPRKSPGWCYRRYWRRQKGRVSFSDGKNTLARHQETAIKRHVKVRGDKSPYDGDWTYWGLRLKRDPTKPLRVTKLLKREKGRCIWCGLRFTVQDVVEVHHWDGNRWNNRYANLALLHAHCHDQIHG